MPAAGREKSERSRTTCRLIALSTDSNTIDLHAIAAIVAHAVVIAPSARENLVHVSPPGVSPRSSQMETLLATLQAYATGSSPSPLVGSGGSMHAALMGSTFGAKATARGGKGKKPAAPTVPAGVSKTSHASGGVDGNSGPGDSQRGRGEWFDVVHNPQWEAPVVFLHHLPELDRLEEESGGASGGTAAGGAVGGSTLAGGGGSSRSQQDFSTSISRALQIIAEDLDETTAQQGSAEGVVLDASGRRGSTEVAVVLAVQDPRAMASLMNRRTTMGGVDTRLILHLIEGVRSGGNGEMSLTANNSTKGRTGGTSKRSTARDSSTNVPSLLREGDGGPPANSFEAWIERQQRERTMAVVNDPTSAAQVPGMVCMRVVMDEGEEDKTARMTAWIERCVNMILPALRNTVRGIARYEEWVSAKSVLRFPLLAHTGDQVVTGGEEEISQVHVSPRQRSKGTSTASLQATAAMREPTRGVPRASTHLPPPVAYGEEMWSQYVRERFVRGQFTCVSAARALASQVTLLMARQQQDTRVYPAAEKLVMDMKLEGNPLCPQTEIAGGSPLAEDALTQEDGEGVEVPSDVSMLKSQGGGSPLRAQLLHYAAQRTTLTPDLDGTDQTTLAASSAAKKILELNPSPPHNTSNSMLTQPNMDESVFSTTATATLPKDHSLDRPTVAPSQEEMRWITHQFVKKGLGAFTVPLAEVNPSTPGASERFQAVMRIQELLEEPLNGLSLEDGEDAVNRHVLALVESAFNSSTKVLTNILADEFNDRSNAAEIPSLSLLLGNTALTEVIPVGERLQRSIERSLTTRERQHILQQILLNGIAIATQMDSTTRTCQNKEDIASASLLSGNTRSIQETVSKPVAVRRLYEFQSRFGLHLCHLIRRIVPDVMESLDLTAAYAVNAGNLCPPKRVTSLMLAGVPTPPRRRSQRLWCHLISGVPSLDQFNELGAGEEVAATGSSRWGIVSFGDQTERRGDAFLGDFMRRQTLEKIMRTKQLFLPAVEEAGRHGSGGGIHTVFEGRHVLYPHEGSIVEAITTDRGRTCRYVRTNELYCALHYSISPPAPSSAATVTSTTATFAAGAVSPTVTTTASYFPLQQTGAPTPSAMNAFLPREETVYFTTAFDDGVRLTCTQRPPPLFATPSPQPVDISGPEKSKASCTQGNPHRSSSARGGARGKRSGGTGSRRQGSSVEDELSSSVTLSRQTRVSRRKNRARDEETPTQRVEEPRRPCPVGTDGSVLLWTHTTQNTGGGQFSLGNANVNESGAESRRLAALALTLAARGVTVHLEEDDGMMWFTYHSSSGRRGPELLRCVHSLTGKNTILQGSMEVELRRVVEQWDGTVCRYFQSGATQTLYANGAVLNRFSTVSKGGLTGPGEVDGESIVYETLTTPEGRYYVRQISLFPRTVSRFMPINQKMESRSTYDRGHHCQVTTREDGVIIANYIHKEVRVSDIETDSGVRPTHEFHALESHYAARVVLHADGTSITTISMNLANSEAAAPLQPLLEQCTTVSSTCDAPVQYCVEMPSLPRLFLCADTNENDDNHNSNHAVGVNHRDTSPAGNNESSYCNEGGTCETDACKLSNRITRDRAASSLSALTDAGDHNFAQDKSPSRREDYALRTERKQRCSFYLLFGDGSILRRRTVYRGSYNPPTPFLETLFTRATETSVRVVHDSGLIVVEPGDAVRRNMTALSALAIGEGFPMFDITCGGMRLVDPEHHIIEVRNLYASGSVHASITPSTLLQLLRQLVSPSYSPHAMPRARQAALQREEEDAEAQLRRERAKGFCPPLIRRLREFAEGFVISHELLRMDVLNTAERSWEGARAARAGGHVTLAAATAACWGGHPMAIPSRPASKRPAHAESWNASPLMGLAASEATRPPPALGITPLYFSELENGLVVQYLHEDDVEECLRTMDGEPFPVFLSRSTASGEPGVQQWTLFRVDAAPKTASSNATSAMRGLTASLSRSSCMASPNWGGRRAPYYGMSGNLSGGNPNATCAVAAESTLAAAVHREEALGLFVGIHANIASSAWIPPSVQPPRRYMQPPTSSKLGNVNGLHVVEAKPSTYERLRVFLRFAAVTPAAKQVVLSGETQRFEQLASLVSYQVAMQRNFAVDPLDEKEQERLREKHLTSPKPTTA